MMNDAYNAGKSSSHVHWHVRPRYAQATTVAGMYFHDPEFTRHYDRARKQEVSVNVHAKIKEKILASW